MKLKLYFLFSDFFITWFIYVPLLLNITFFCSFSILLLCSLRNIFKIFFFTESLLLLCVIFLSQTSTMFFNDSVLHLFYCQIILAIAAAEAALFLGLFSHLYDQQLSTRPVRKKNFNHYFWKKINNESKI